MEQSPYRPGDQEPQHRQTSFLAPEAWDFLHRMRGLVAEAERLYETRTLHPTPDAPVMRTPEDVYVYLRPLMADEPREQFRVLTLTTRHQLIRSQLLYQGAVNGTIVRCAEVFRPAVLDNATSIMARSQSSFRCSIT